MPTWSSSDIRVTNISKSFTRKMAAETSWHRYETKLRHCHPTYRYNVLPSSTEPAVTMVTVLSIGRPGCIGPYGNETPIFTLIRCRGASLCWTTPIPDVTSRGDCQHQYTVVLGHTANSIAWSTGRQEGRDTALLSVSINVDFHYWFSNTVGLCHLYRLVDLSVQYYFSGGDEVELLSVCSRKQGIFTRKQGIFLTLLYKTWCRPSADVRGRQNVCGSTSLVRASSQWRRGVCFLSCNDFWPRVCGISPRTPVGTRVQTS